MYKVMYWCKSLVGEKGIAKIEHYFTDSKAAIEYFYGQTKVHKNVALVVSVKHAECVFMSYYSDDFPEELRPHTFTQIFTEIDSTDKTTSMYDVFEKCCGFRRPIFRFNQDESVEEI